MVTGADGTFELASSAAVRIHVPKTHTLSFVLRDNAIAFSPSAGKLSGNVTILSGTGRCIVSTDFSGINPVTEQIRLPQFASGVNIVCVTVNTTVYTCQVIRLGNELHLIKKHTGSPSDGDFTLAKRALSSKVVDTIITTKERFKDAILPIESYFLSDVSIEMDSSVAGGEIAWGRKENPTANCCQGGDLPGYSELKANPKLPDPFMMLNGTRITKKSEWACRREELYRQALRYIYGDKPIPSKGSVSGTVSTSKISVEVTDGGKSCSFSAEVNMNGANHPAPAIIVFGSFGGPPVPKGVASITFNAIETGNFHTEALKPPNPEDHYDWDAPELAGEL